MGSFAESSFDAFAVGAWNILHAKRYFYGRPQLLCTSGARARDMGDPPWGGQRGARTWSDTQATLRQVVERERIERSALFIRRWGRHFNKGAAEA